MMRLFDDGPIQPKTSTSDTLKRAIHTVTPNMHEEYDPR